VGVRDGLLMPALGRSHCLIEGVGTVLVCHWFVSHFGSAVARFPKTEARVEFVKAQVKASY
jgi:hypothetical protein